VHSSYHKDGRRHTKIGDETVHPSADIPIADWRGVRQLQNMSLSVSDDWLNSATEYSGDSKSETIVIVDEHSFTNVRRCSLDVWLFDRDSEAALLTQLGAAHWSDRFRLVAEIVVALDHFPGHKLALTLRSELALPPAG
jgi:hypothetical protein